MEKFWASEDLVGELLPFLDVHSLVALVSFHGVTVALIQREAVWQDILAKTFKPNISEPLEVYEEMVDKVLELLEQVDMGRKKETLHLALLEHICKSFSATSTGWEVISLRSGADTPILVSPTGLILLERAQEKGCRNVVLGPVEEVKIKWSKSLGKALMSMIVRQETLGKFDCVASEADFEDLLIIMLLTRCCQWYMMKVTSSFWSLFNFNGMWILSKGSEGDRYDDEEGWEAIEMLMERMEVFEEEEEEMVEEEEIVEETVEEVKEAALEFEGE